MKRGNDFTNFIQKLKYTRYDLQRVSRLVNDPKLSKTYFPETPRKSRFAIWRDNLLWLVRHKEVNRYYYVYGLDRKNNEAAKEVLPYRTFRIIRDSKNLHPAGENFNYVCLLRDKFIFGQLLTSLYFPTPKNIALLHKTSLTWLDDMRTVPLSAITENTTANINGFCKKLTGIMGEGAFPLRVSNGKIWSGETELSVAQFSEKITGHYLLQECINQHPAMSNLHAHSVNTIRMITFNNDGKIDVFCATLRIGTKHQSVDNWASGGIVVGIDLQTGTLRREGFFKPGYGGRVEKHPDTAVILNGYEIPYFKESIDMACRLHSCLYGIHSVGWDIAITPDGPVFIEGNDDWEGGIPMALEENFKTRFLKMFPANGAAIDVRHANTIRSDAN